MLKRCFPPVVDSKTRVLVLGSLPGEESLAQARYYAHPQNQFWRLIGRVIEKDLVQLSYEKRLEALLEAGVGLWDTVGSASRRGSLDGNIRDTQANDLVRLAVSLPDLRAVGFNGGKSAALGMKQLEENARLALIPLPSSSPAYTLAFEAKAAEWMKLRSWL
ncbi:MAG TPA: DNA-deoxyinosine glycosylase [Allosphingosinicella sp.]